LFKKSFFKISEMLSGKRQKKLYWMTYFAAETIGNVVEQEIRSAKSWDEKIFADEQAYIMCFFVYLYFREKRPENFDELMNEFVRILEGFGKQKWLEGIKAYSEAWDKTVKQGRHFDGIQTVAYIRCFGEVKANEMWKSFIKTLTYNFKITNLFEHIFGLLENIEKSTSKS